MVARPFRPPLPVPDDAAHHSRDTLRHGSSPVSYFAPGGLRQRPRDGRLCVYLSHTLMTSHAAMIVPSAPSAPTIMPRIN
jgi:hypothetical protein